MDTEGLVKELNLANPVLSITRMNNPGKATKLSGGCTLRSLNRSLSGETIYLTAENGPCKGGATGFGLRDGLPQVPGGIGYFISYGRGDKYPPGERVKCNPEVAEQGLLGLPQNVMDGYDTIRVKPYEVDDEADTVTFFANPDQLCALIHLYAFRKVGYDTVIAPMVSGCASIFRIPFGELQRDEPRAVIGNVDIFSRPHFDANLLNFTVSAKDYMTMLKDADECFFIAPIWKGIKKRLLPNQGDYPEN